jgi:hypothetical protein
MTTLVRGGVEGGPGAIQLSYAVANHHIIIGVYGHVEVRPANCDCDAHGRCRHLCGKTHVTFTWIQARAPFMRVEFIGKMGVSVEWLLGRELLRDGGGDLDVLIEHAEDLVDLRLSSPNGAARVLLDRAWVDALLTASDEIVPIGKEFAEVPWEALLEEG